MLLQENNQLHRIKIRPNQKTIIASGFSKTKQVETAQKLGAGKYKENLIPWKRQVLRSRKNWNNRQFLTSSSIEVYSWNFKRPKNL